MKKTGRASTPADESLRDRTDIQDTLLALGHDGGLDPLKSIFWSLLNYNKSNKPLSRRNWTDSRKSALKEDPLLLATGGVDEAFHIIYARLASDALKLSLERPVIESLLNEHPYSLFVFSNEAQNRWHFVNVKIASGDEDENRDHKRRRLFRRITIGPDERLRTATDRVNFLDLAQFQTDLFGISPLAIQKQHDEAFDVEAVTRSFYNDYRQVFDALQNDLASQSGDPVWAHDYSLQFLNRCMFIYFIQRKRWLANDRDFFLNFWKSYQKSSHKPDTFFELWMKALFFQAFNNGTIEDNASMPPHILEALRNAPYLNGGLFAQNELDTLFNRRHAVIIDERFKKTIEFLEAYNFTVSEDTPLDQEVAVDAEMLGKVYESLVNVSADTDERGDAGIFYTPRTEIDLMCRLSLVDNLTNHLGPQYKNLLYETIFTFTHEDQQSADSKLLKAGLWDKIDRHLRQITVIDPACGSGSFLVGMLQVIDGLQERANAALGTQESAYSRRRRIIGQSLYGVDVKPWAVDIAELRLWLQLVIESDLNARELKATPLLPNLSFKIRRGDSLMQEIGGMNTSRHGGYSQIPDKSTQAKIEKLKKAKLDFYNNKGSSSRNDLNMEELLVFHELLESRENYLIRKKTALSRPKVEDMFQHPKTQMSDQEKDTLEQQLAELRRTRNALKNVKDVPFVWNIAFVEIFEGEKNGFDIVIGNPPYVRQEQISNPLVSRDQVTTENKKDYKNRLIHSVYMLYPEFFGNPNQPSHKLNAKSDLYIYFYFHGLSLLNPKGSFCFITSNSWLDVGYGADLQEFLLTQGHVKMIMDNQAKRSFAQADVNTIIALLSPPAAKDENGVKKEEMARFVLFRVPFEQVLSPVIFEEIEAATERRATPEYRIFPIGREKLFLDGCEIPEDTEEEGGSTAPALHIKRYIGNKWGGKYLRAPDIYWTILEKGKGKLVRLGDIALVRRGFTTGANEFFYLDEARIKEWGIEEEFLKPVIKSPRECKRILIDPKDLKYKIFMCHNDKKALRGTAALEYIHWGESQGYHTRPSCRGRARWWVLGALKPIYIERSTYNEIHDFTYNEIGVMIDKVMYGIDTQINTNPANLGICLNSIMTALQIEIIGSLGLGEGALFISVEDSKDKVMVFDIKQASKSFEEIFRRFCFAESYSIKEAKNQSERIALDSIIFDALGLTSGERDAVYEAVINLVEARLNKAQNV